MNDIGWMARKRAGNYHKALKYLDTCGELTFEKWVKVNRIAGIEMDESQLRTMWEMSQMTLEGPEALRSTLRNTLKKGMTVFGYTADGLNEIGRKQKKWWEFWK